MLSRDTKSQEDPKGALPRPRRGRLVAIILVAFVVVAVILLGLSWKDVKQVIAEATWPATVLAVVFCLASDACLSYGYVLVNRAFGVKIPGGQLLEVGFVSSTLNNIMALFGAAGHSMRVILLRHRGLESGEIVAASLFHSYVSNAVMLALFAVGLVALSFGHTEFGSRPEAVVITSALVIILLIAFTTLIAMRRTRRWFLALFVRLWRRLIRRDIGRFISDLDASLNKGVEAFSSRRILFTFLLLVTLAEWAFEAGGLWFCFAALGKGPPLSVLLSGFSIGISAGNLSMIPGGLGVQEASMAGVFALLGVSFAQAALAAILFRVTNNFIPFFISLPLYSHVVRRH